MPFPWKKLPLALDKTKAAQTKALNANNLPPAVVHAYIGQCMQEYHPGICSKLTGLQSDPKIAAALLKGLQESAEPVQPAGTQNLILRVLEEQKKARTVQFGDCKVNLIPGHKKEHEDNMDEKKLSRVLKLKGFKQSLDFGILGYEMFIGGVWMPVKKPSNHDDNVQVRACCGNGVYRSVNAKAVFLAVEAAEAAEKAAEAAAASIIEVDPVAPAPTTTGGGTPPRSGPDAPALITPAKTNTNAAATAANDPAAAASVAKNPPASSPVVATSGTGGAVAPADALDKETEAGAGATAAINPAAAPKDDLTCITSSITVCM